MFLKIWNYLRGYVRISLSGFSVERFINMAAYRGVYFWDVCEHDGGIAVKCSLAAFRSLRPHAKKTKSRIRIIERHGLPFIFHRYRKRRLLAAGALLFASALYFMASFVWLIEVEGNERLSNDEIISILDEAGLYIGALKAGIDYRDTEQALMSFFSEDIAFASVSIRGTRALITIHETILPPEIVDYSIPADIIAAKDGLIISIATARGRPLVRAGDVVAAGDVLVSGELRIAASDFDETLYTVEHVRADSRVMARMYYNLYIEVPFQFYEKIFTGNVSRNYGIIISDREYGIWTRLPTFAAFDTIERDLRLSLGRNYPMPISLITTEFREYERVLSTRTLDDAMHFGIEQLTEQILHDFSEAEIIRQEVSFFEGINAARVEVFLVTIERIDEIREIVVEPDVEPVP